MVVNQQLTTPYHHVDPQQAVARTADGAVLLDVRDPAEWHAGHARWAWRIPLGQLAEVPTDRPVITACRSRARSRQATALLAREGRQIHDLTGGMRAWTSAALPLHAIGGQPGRVS
ncbi:rhodanese-like domain-containing protein [Actinoplanes flavus]|uniref:Rhodanese-like domain-containing protein n=1 Tax=Actinoplanes flavus TaxID=2820290 RepID=A0ABS3UZ76_9ACTN|nr:rhodanese-like domain-containing protein [Actinoplanes flavus]MBO3743874.1 rhodanese-like domain-containing protein [Actinoplanes flavus]